MYKGFNFKLKRLSSIDYIYDNINESYDDGKILNENNKSQIQSELEKFLRDDNKLDGTSIKEAWFPQIKADVFISHSHNNEVQAIALAGWLNKNFGLNCFIDSLVWNYAPNLIDKLNNTYNVIVNNPPNKTYEYQTAKYISSHIDLMLNTALNNMIDHCEALIFLNTPESTGQAIENDKIDISKVEIESPWIYSELETSRIVREKLGRTRHKMMIKSFSRGGTIAMESLNESRLPPIVYDADIKHLYKLTKEDLEEWKRIYKSRNPRGFYSVQHPLDTLYDLMKVEDLNNK